MGAPVRSAPKWQKHLGYTQITYATELVACEGDKVQARKETADGYDVLLEAQRCQWSSP